MEDHESISMFAHESIMARMERTVKRLFIALIFSIVIIFATNMAWLYMWMQYDYMDTDTDTVQTEQVTLDSGGEGSANYIEKSNVGDIVNGTDNSQENNEN